MSELLLGIRLALKGSRARMLVTSMALAFAVAFLLAALGGLPARQAKLDRLAARAWVHAHTPDQVPKEGLLITEFGTFWRGRPVGGRQVAPVGRSPLPPGLRSIPRPGELAVSPDLAAVLRGPHAAELASRLPGRVTQVIGKTGLAGPHELFAYVGVPAATLRGTTSPTAGFGYRAPALPVPQELRTAAWLGAVALLLPVLVLVATATRLASAARDTRLAAVRLVGASVRQTARLVAGEALFLGVVGSALGLVAFLSLRGFAASLLPFPDGLYAEDLAAPTAQVVLVLVGVPVLSVLTALLAMRRVVVTPLAVRRQVRVRRAGWWRLVPLVLGLSMLGLMRLRAHPLGGFPAFLLLGGGALTLVGLALAAPVVARLSGHALGRVPGVSPTLAARRIGADPGASARVITGTVLVVFVGAWLLAFLPVISAYQHSDASTLRQYLPGSALTTYAAPGGQDAVLRSLSGLPRTTAVTVGTVVVGKPSVNRFDEATADEVVTFAVGSCTQLARVLRADLGCDGSEAYRFGSSMDAYADSLLPGRVRLPAFDGYGHRVGSVVLPRAMHALRGGPDLLSNLFGSPFLLEPGAVPATALATSSLRVIIRTGPSAAEVERVRAALPGYAAFGAMTLDEQLAIENRTYDGYLRAVRIGVVLALVVGACSLLVATADGMRERRRGMAALVALGTPLRVLRRSVVLQMAAPALLNVLVALGAGAIASATYLGTAAADGGPSYALPWTAWGLVGAAGLVVVLLATAVTLPLVTATGRPEALRGE